MTIRTRFAPSPTGNVHIGNMRAAIYNWLFARHTGGQFLLRIEDTDRERSTAAACQTVLDTMAWLGLNYDEPPLYQSHRLDAHRAAAEELVRKGLAYREDKGGTGKGECIIFKMPGTDVSYHDEVKGDLCKKAQDLKDFVIVRSDGNPVFHLANVLDDIHMGVTHVIRGDDHVENTFRHIALFRAFEAPVPAYAHLSMIVNAQGKPYSKRDGAAYVGDFQTREFLPQALFNYLTLLGWSPGDGREVLTIPEMISAFSFAGVQSSPAQFDAVKLHWMNGEHMRRLPDAERMAGHLADLRAHGLAQEDGDAPYVRRVLEVMEDRIKLFSETAAQTAYFFTDDFSWDDKAVRKRLLKPGAMDALRALRDRFAAVPVFDHASLEASLKTLAAERGLQAADFIHPARVAVSGSGAGPGLFALFETLGRNRVLARLDAAVKKYKAQAPA